MNFTKLSIEGLVVIEPKVFGDDRGFFMETYNKKVYQENGVDLEFVQDNHSRSSKGVLRGLHCQAPPFAQDKLVRVTRGAVLDVAVDIRVGSPTFGRYESVELSEENKKMFLVPIGFLHGFVALTDVVDFQYKTTNFYSAEHDMGVIWNDPEIGVEWGVEKPILSDKDKELPLLKEFKSPFKF